MDGILSSIFQAKEIQFTSTQARGPRYLRAAASVTPVLAAQRPILQKAHTCHKSARTVTWGTVRPSPIVMLLEEVEEVQKTESHCRCQGYQSQHCKQMSAKDCAIRTRKGLGLTKHREVAATSAPVTQADPGQTGKGLTEHALAETLPCPAPCVAPSWPLSPTQGPGARHGAEQDSGHAGDYSLSSLLG